MKLKDGKYVLTQEECQFCTEFKEQNSGFKDGSIKEIDIGKLKEKDKFWDIMNNLGIDGTPSIIEVTGDKICLVDHVTNMTSKCTSTKPPVAAEDYIMNQFKS